MLSISTKKVTYIPDFPQVPAVWQKTKIRCYKKSGETNWCRLAVGSGRFLSLAPAHNFHPPLPSVSRIKTRRWRITPIFKLFSGNSSMPQIPLKKKNQRLLQPLMTQDRKKTVFYSAVSLYLFVLSGKSSKFLLFSPLSPLNNVANSTRWWWRKEGENPLNRVEKSLKCVWTF